MQEFLIRLTVGVLIVSCFFLLIGLVKDANAADYSNTKELFVKNEAGGVIAVTQELCQDPKAKAKGFEYRGYATEKDGTLHEGCWTAPDVSDAPNIPGVKIIPIVNIYFEGEVILMPQNKFKPMSQLKEAL